MKMSLPSILALTLLSVPIIGPFNLSRAYGQSLTVERPMPGAEIKDDGAQIDEVDGRVNDDGAQIKDDDQGTPRVARLNSIKGYVSFQRAGDKEWVEAVRNLPLLTGDQIYTSDRSSATIQLAHGTFIRLSERTALGITDLSEQGAQFEITSGSAVVQLYRLEEIFGRFEIDTPLAAAVLQRDGAYRVQIADDGETELTTRDGLAEVTTEDATLKVRAGFKLLAGGNGSGKLDVVAVASFDDWDLTGADATADATHDAVGPDPVSAPSPDYVGSYQDTYSSLYGLDELSGCGTWTNVASYGNCWIPRVGYDWAPYRSGRWLWVPALGWTWLPAESWGWAPYHYGRWSFIPGLGWAWVPGFGARPVPYGYGYHYYAWRPALVYFFNYSTPGGRYVGWQPLRPGEVWHRPGWYERHHDQQGWGRPIYHAANNGVSVVPIGAFSGSAAGRPQAPNPEHRRVLEGVYRPQPGAPGISAGLAGVQPGRFAGVPVHPIDGGRAAGIQPPSGIIGRPVVTRHLPAVATDDGGLGRRERRVVEPGPRVPQGLNPGSEPAGSGGSYTNSGSQGDASRGARRHSPAFDDPEGSSGSGSGNRPNRSDEPRSARQEGNSAVDDGTVRHKDRGSNSGQFGGGQPSGQNYEPKRREAPSYQAPRSESPRYEAPANRPAHQPERESPKSSGGSGGSNGSGNQNNSGAGSQKHVESHQDNSGQNSGSSSHNNGQPSGSSGNSGNQSSGSSTQAKPSKKN